MMSNWLTLQLERAGTTGWRGQEKGRSVVAVREQKLAPAPGTKRVTVRHCQLSEHGVICERILIAYTYTSPI